MIKLILRGNVLFEIYKDYNRLDIESTLRDRFFFYVIENLIQIADLETEIFDDIRIFSVEDEYATLLDQKIDLYKKKDDVEYCQFYQHIRDLGLKYLTQAELRRSQL